jgi:glutathione S-transferase
LGSIILFGDRATPFTEKVARGLVLKKLEHELVKPKSPEDLWRWNPEKGEMPVLQLGSERIVDSTRILERLDREFPEPPFVSADPKVAAAQRRLEDWADNVFLWYWRAWRAAVQRREAAVAAARTPTWLQPLKRALGSAEAGSTRDPAALVSELGRRLDDLVGFLGDRPYFYAYGPGMADLAVYAGFHAVWSGSWETARGELARRPALLGFMERIENETGPRYEPDA